MPKYLVIINQSFLVEAPSQEACLAASGFAIVESARKGPDCCLEVCEAELLTDQPPQVQADWCQQSVDATLDAVGNVL